MTLASCSCARRQKASTRQSTRELWGTHALIKPDEVPENVDEGASELFGGASELSLGTQQEQSPGFPNPDGVQKVVDQDPSNPEQLAEMVSLFLGNVEHVVQKTADDDHTRFAAWEADMQHLREEVQTAENNAKANEIIDMYVK